jgi:hypothetical protein
MMITQLMFGSAQQNMPSHGNEKFGHLGVFLMHSSAVKRSTLLWFYPRVAIRRTKIRKLGYAGGSCRSRCFRGLFSSFNFRDTA